MNLCEILDEVINESLVKLVISNKRNKKQRHQKGIVRLVQTKHSMQFQLEIFSETQAFHENLDETQVKKRLLELAQDEFKQMDIFTSEFTYLIKINDLEDIFVKKKQEKEKKAVSLHHNRKKKYLLEEGMMIEPLIDLGIFSAEGKVIASKYDKYKQINRFIEMIDDVISKETFTSLNIVDFGCGKSYLTFVLYYYLVELKHIKTSITGLDLKEEVIQHCNAIAKRYKYEGLSFQMGDIADFETKDPVDMVITLHACDTATDLALYHAIQWNSSMIFSVPCCQHELNDQFKSNEFSLLSKYGIIKERISSLMTDAMRGQLLEICGYDVTLLEFIDIEHSPKNILIRAIRKTIDPKKKQQKIEELHRVEEAFQAKLTLHTLLKEHLGE